MSRFVYHHVRLMPEQQIGSHAQETWELSYVEQGQGRRMISDDANYFFEGEVVLIPPGFPHQWVFEDTGKEIENYTLMFDNQLLEGIKAIFPESSKVVDCILMSDAAISIRGQARREIAALLKKMDAQDEYQRVASFLEILGLIYRRDEAAKIAFPLKPKRTTTRQEKLEIFAVCNYQRKITIEEIARHLGMNRTSFCSFLKRTMNVTFSEYMNNFRVRRACELLAATDWSITQIAAETGFANRHYFDRVFKEKTGLTPQEYRINHQNITNL